MSHTAVMPRLAFLALAPALFLFGNQALAAGGAGGETVATGPTRTLDLAYDIYVGGVTLGKVDMSARMQGGDYKVVSSLDTAGIVNRFWQSHIQASSSGELQGNRIHPGTYDSTSTHTGSDKTQVVNMKYSGDAPATVEADPPYSEKYPIPEDQKKDTFDPGSAILRVATGVAATADNPCGAVTPVFDGRRRYDVLLRFVKKTDVKLDNGVYAGPALLCEIKYIQVAGYKQKILDENKKLPQMFAWIASVPSRTDPSKTYLVPLRLWATTDFGIAAAVASKVRLDGGPLAADRRAELVVSRP